MKDIDKLIIWASACEINEEKFPYDSKKLLELTKLDLSGECIQAIPKEIRLLQQLKELYLTNCGLTILPLELFALTQLKNLTLQNNYLISIPNEINNLKNLEVLDLQNNHIQTAPLLEDLQKLKHIDISKNRLAKNEVETLKPLLKQGQLSFKNQKQILPFIIEPLSIQNLDDAISLHDSIFTDTNDIEKHIIIASFYKNMFGNLYKEYEDIYKENEIETAQYWVAIDPIKLQVIGLTGLYSEINDTAEECWLGWFCIDKKYRGCGFGKELLQFSEEQAKTINKNIMKIYTYNTKKYARAIEMYKKFGYEKYHVKDTKYKRDLYFKKVIVEKPQNI